MNEDIKLKSSVIAITDHRPLDIAWTWSNVPVKIETVGSCATLVARNILQKNPDILDAQLSSLLRSKSYLSYNKYMHALGRRERGARVYKFFLL